MLITVHVLCMPWEIHVYHRWTGVHISPFWCVSQGRGIRCKP